MYAIRSTIFSIGYSVATVFYSTLAVLLFMLPFKTRHKMIISWTIFIVWWVNVTMGVKYRVSGNINPDTQKPVVVLSKHQSTWETFFLQGKFWPSSTILKRELLRIPFFGWGLKALNPIAIDRTNPRESLKQVRNGAKDRLDAGYNLILFPEGTRIGVDEQVKYARSGADIAIANNVDIIPVAHNAGHFWPCNKGKKRAGVIDVVIGEPISPEGKTSKALIAEVELWIESQVAALPAPLSISVKKSEQEHG